MFHYSIPCELIFGAGSLKELGKSVRKTGGSEKSQSLRLRLHCGYRGRKLHGYGQGREYPDEQ